MSIYLTVIVKVKPEHQQAMKAMLDSLPEFSRKEAAMSPHLYSKAYALEKVK